MIKKYITLFNKSFYFVQLDKSLRLDGIGQELRFILLWILCDIGNGIFRLHFVPLNMT